MENKTDVEIIEELYKEILLFVKKWEYKKGEQYWIKMEWWDMTFRIFTKDKWKK